MVIKIHGVKQNGRLPIVETGRAGYLALNEVGGRVMRAVASAAIPIRIRKSRDGSRCCQAHTTSKSGIERDHPVPPARILDLRVNFFGPDPAYHEARRQFVFKGYPLPAAAEPSTDSSSGRGCSTGSYRRERPGLALLSTGLLPW